MAEVEPEFEPEPEPEPELPLECYNGTCIYYVGTDYTGIDCSKNNESNPLYSYCYPTPSSLSSDTWAGAKYKCDSLGLTLTTVSQLQSIYNNKSNYPSISCITSGRFMTSQERTNSKNPQYYQSNYGLTVSFSDGKMYNSNGKAFKGAVICIEQ